MLFHVIQQDSQDEVWLFADLFSALLMTIVLLINADASLTKPQPTDAMQAAPESVQLVYLHDSNLWSLAGTPQESVESVLATLSDLDHPVVELVAPSSLDAGTMHGAFLQLEEAGIKYYFTIQETNQ